MAEAIPIFQTKLYRPQIPVYTVFRHSLLERLDRHRQPPLTLVSAPVGYGKTTLVSCLVPFDITLWPTSTADEFG
jgi:LuxR family maltose regulon positive regulatory protein